MADPAFPRSIRFPFGYLIKVRRISRGHLARRNDGMEAHGLWDGVTKTIYLDKDMTAREQVYVLSHEMIHAIADFQHYCMALTREEAL